MYLSKLLYVIGAVVGASALRISTFIPVIDNHHFINYAELESGVGHGYSYGDREFGARKLSPEHEYDSYENTFTEEYHPRGYHGFSDTYEPIGEHLGRLRTNVNSNARSDQEFHDVNRNRNKQEHFGHGQAIYEQNFEYTEQAARRNIGNFESKHPNQQIVQKIRTNNNSKNSPAYPVPAPHTLHHGNPLTNKNKPSEDNLSVLEPWVWGSSEPDDMSIEDLSDRVVLTGENCATGWVKLKNGTCVQNHQ